MFDLYKGDNVNERIAEGQRKGDPDADFAAQIAKEYSELKNGNNSGVDGFITGKFNERDGNTNAAKKFVDLP